MAITYLDDEKRTTSPARRITYLDEGPNELTRRSILSSGPAKFASGAGGTGAGAYLGGQAGAALGAMFPPAIPITTTAGAIIGAGLGYAGAEQARRYGAARLEYDTPEGEQQAIARSLNKIPEDVSVGAISQALPMAGGYVARRLGLGPAIAKGYTRLRETLTGVAPGSSARVLERGTKIIKPQYAEGAPLSVTGKVQRGVERFLQDARTSWRSTSKTVEARLESRYTNLTEPFTKFRQSLVDSQIIAESGKPERTFFPRAVSGGTQRASARLRTVLSKLNQVVRRGGYVTGKEAQKAIREIDDVVTYGRKGVNPISDQEEALLKSLRGDLLERVAQDIPGYARRNRNYAKALGLYEKVQPKVTDQSVASTVRGMATRSNEFPFPEMQQIDKMLPKGYRFVNTIQDYLAGREFTKPVNMGRLAPMLAFPGVGLGTFGLTGSPLATGAALMSTGLGLSPSLYARELGMWRSFAPFAKRAVPYVERGVAPLLSGSVAALREE